MIQQTGARIHNTASDTLISPHPAVLRKAAIPKVQFGSAAPTGLKQVPPKISKALQYFDFRDLGFSHVGQIQLVYAGCILWRLIAANERRKASPSQSWNEIRESALRDSVGYAFWFFGTPTLQRLYLKVFPSQEMEKALIQPNRNNETGLWATLKKWNPISGYAIPTSEQVRDMKTQAIARLENASIEKSSGNFQRVEKYYKKLLHHRNMATGMGLLSTIGLLGIGINYLNFYLTQKNVRAREMALQKPSFPRPPQLPRFQPIVSASPVPMNQAPNGLPLQQHG
ncbi:hypothetical protein [Vampirovibrio chlorellavorus]|uniref:hypothetical protein n=1 Tax=Vampirovibrio chlorellavorus TaxID=758823 RepID=UPI0026EB16BD|nr:hypothetical protein [Vampirovibrio chlorellavorus]